MVFNSPAKFSSLALSMLAGACAGPTTPFGALSEWNPKSDSSGASPRRDPSDEGHKTWVSSLFADNEEKPLHARIVFLPARQNLHGKSIFRFVVRDDRGLDESAHVRILYNGDDQTKNFLSQSSKTLNKARSKIEFRMQNLRLPAKREHSIQVIYSKDGINIDAEATLPPPTCAGFAKGWIASTGDFSPPMEWIEEMQSKAQEQNINPAMLAALVAQESGFDARALSWSKAIGLMQITPIADRELSVFHADWPRYSDVENLSFPHLKLLVESGRINSKQDWRLDPQLSIAGGLTYLNTLKSYWTSAQNLELIRKSYLEADEVLTDLVLASYNSGATRVLGSLKQHGSKWLDSEELNAARTYVRKIISYCYEFSQPVSGESFDENET